MSTKEQISAWGLANAIRQHFALGNAEIAKSYGKDLEVLPFGSNVSVQNQQGPMSWIAPLALTALALGGGGVGLAALGGWLPSSAPPSAVASPEKTKPQIVEGVIDWELSEQGEFDAIVK